MKNLNAGKMVRDINFSLYEGEIVGFAGLMGAGRTETTRAIFGVDPKDSGEVYVDGKKLKSTVQWMLSETVLYLLLRIVKRRSVYETEYSPEPGTAKS